MKAAGLLIAAVIIVLSLPAMLTSLDDFRLDEQVDTYVVTTDNSTTTYSATLSQDLYNDDEVNASVSSNYTSDAPIASSYTAASNALLITGLAISQTHYLTVTYNIEGLTDYYGAFTATRMIPLLFVLGIMAIVVGSAVNAWRRYE